LSRIRSGILSGFCCDILSGIFWTVYLAIDLTNIPRTQFGISSYKKSDVLFGIVFGPGGV
jgi:hypothetical protein